MSRHTLYSESPRRAPRSDADSVPRPKAPKAREHRHLLFAAAGAMLVSLLVLGYRVLAPAPAPAPPENAAAPPGSSPAVRAYEVIRPSVVQVRGFADHPDAAGGREATTGTGVVILESGVILTNLHVVVGAGRVLVTFADGLESEAAVTGVRPEQDLAVLQAKTLPDDLAAATIRTTAGLAPGDFVAAVGFPFGVGPSVSAGVVSGLGREYRSPEGKRVLSDLIQFDAAVNPGNSGGPLVIGTGEVVGIVTGVLNPTGQRFFVGIGFAVPIETAVAAVGVPPF
jgi:S1-C subfamily serine protease